MTISADRAQELAPEERSERRRIGMVPPKEVVLAARATMGGVDLDPYATASTNRRVQAARFYNREQEDVDSIASRQWNCGAEKRVFIAPEGKAIPTRRLLNKLLREYRAGNINEAVIWLVHNESLCKLPWLWTFPICIPFRRFRPSYYDDELDLFRQMSPSFWSPVIYLPPAGDPQRYEERMMRFYAAFSGLGRIVHDTENGPDDWEDAYQVSFKTPFNYRA